MPSDRGGNKDSRHICPGGEEGEIGRQSENKSWGMRRIWAWNEGGVVISQGIEDHKQLKNKGISTNLKEMFCTHHGIPAPNLAPSESIQAGPIPSEPLRVRFRKSDQAALKAQRTV